MRSRSRLAVLWPSARGRRRSRPGRRPALDRAADAGRPRASRPDLRVLTDEIGGRVTGSAGYEKALQWGVEAFRRAGVDSVKLEAYPVAGEMGRRSGRGRRSSRRARSRSASSPSALAPSTPGALTAPLVDVGDGRRADFDRLGATAQGRDRARAIEADDSPSTTSSPSTWPAPETMQAAVDHGRRGDPLHLDAAARPALPPHDHLGPDRADPDGAGRARGRPAAGAAARGGRGAARSRSTSATRSAGPGEARERRRRDPGQREARRDRAARRAPRRLGPRHGRARQRRQLRARRGGGARDRGRAAPEAHDPLRALHGRGDGPARLARLRARAPRRARPPRRGR